MTMTPKPERFLWTGEVRRPTAGEWFISVADTPMCATNDNFTVRADDASGRRPILKPLGDRVVVERGVIEEAVAALITTTEIARSSGYGSAALSADKTLSRLRALLPAPDPVEEGVHPMTPLLCWLFGHDWFYTAEINGVRCRVPATCLRCRRTYLETTR